MFGRARRRMDKIIKDAQTKKVEVAEETTEDTEPVSNDFQKVFTLPDCQAIIRYARMFKRCSDWDWDNDHKNIIVTFNEKATETDVGYFEHLIDKDPAENYCEITALKILEHIKNNGELWDIYEDKNKKTVAYLNTDTIKIKVITDYFDGFGDSGEDTFYIKIDCTRNQGKTITMNDKNVSYYVQEDFWNVLTKTLYERQEGLFDVAQYELDKLCGK